MPNLYMYTAVYNVVYIGKFVTVLLRKLYSSRLMSSKLPSKMTATERQLRATRHFNRSTSRIGQCSKVAGYTWYQSNVGDGDKFTNLWKMLRTTSTKLAKQDYVVIPLDVQTSVSMPPAIDPSMVLMMNAKEGQPAYWRTGENGLEFVRWAAPVPTPDSRFEAAHIKNCEERLARKEEQLQQRTVEKTAVEEQLQAVKEQHKRDVDTFQTEKSSLQSRIDAEIDAMWRQTTGASHGTHSCLEQQKRSSAPNASTHISKVAHSPCALVPLSMVQKKNEQSKSNVI